MEKTFTNEVVKAAESFLKQQETKNNSGFKDPEFEKKMRWVGWIKGHPWCAYFVELVYKTANINLLNSSELYALFDALFSGSVMKTYNNFVNFIKKNQNFFKISNTPKVGSIVIWRSKINPLSGHTGIVVEIKNANEFYTIEGNTDEKGGREGHEVAKRLRNMSGNGFKLIGFIEPIF